MNSVTTPAIYRHVGSGIWNEITADADTGTNGAYTYAEATTPGFSHFLIAQSASAPTAISLQSFSGASTGSPLIPVFGAVLLISLGINVLRKRASE